jgi:hypothetical protein
VIWSESPVFRAGRRRADKENGEVPPLEILAKAFLGTLNHLSNNNFYHELN